jgi:hypothetical protein
MATQPLPNGDDEPRTATLSHVPADAGAPVEALVSGTVGDRCVACGSPLSSDQRYCVVCGERRGAPRFSLPAAGTVVEETVTSSAPPPKPPRSARLGSGTTLVAGVATLLLAVLVGVLIGHGSAGSGAKTVAGPTKIIKINSGAAPAAPTSTGSTVTSGTPAGSASKGSASKGGGAKGGSTKGGASKGAAKKPPVSKQAAAAQQQAASKVLGGSNNAPPTVTVGQKAAKGTPGVNKKTGKFDGSFFGG